ncbi:MAG: glutamine synthetase type III, partial [Oscillospiraceae bacterium]|nr:glutamine synthetase type III [Oscillospiraceae bacterium]
LEAGSQFEDDLHELIKESLTAHRRILFNGNGYEDNWVLEAERRGLANLPNAASALPTYILEKNIELMTHHGVLSRQEMLARHEIHMEGYSKLVRIEASTLVDMVQHQLLGASIAYGDALCQTILHKKAALPGTTCRVETALAGSLNQLSEDLLDRCAELKTVLETMPQGLSAEEEMNYCHSTITPAAARVRAIIDHMETLVASDYWPVPIYSELLYSV